MRTRNFFVLAVCLGSSRAAAATGDCGKGFKVCSAPGSSGSTPQINTPDFQNLFVDIVQSSLPSSSSKRSLDGRASTSLCCNELLSCLTMSSIGIPFCYDRFTTNYVLPDGASGTVVGGWYTNLGGDKANLESGDYTLANGQTGNIYASDPAAKPNIAALPMPSQFTASGIGSAVPVSSLGIQVTLTYTTTFPGTTIPPHTVPPSTIPGSTVVETHIIPSTVTTIIGDKTQTIVWPATSLSPLTLQASVIAGSTISASTIPPSVSVVTTTTVASTTANAKKNGAGRLEMGGVLAVVCAATLCII